MDSEEFGFDLLLVDFRNKNSIEPELFLKILADKVPFIYVIVNQGESDGYSILHDEDNKNLRKQKHRDNPKRRIKKYKWYPDSKEYRAFFVRHSRRYHRIILPDLLRGTDSYGHKLFWFDSEEKAQAYLELMD